MANIFATRLTFEVEDKKIEGVTTPRINKPDFTLGGLGFHLSSGHGFDGNTHSLCLGLSEASKQSLFNGSSIKIKKADLSYIKRSGETGHYFCSAKKDIVKSAVTLLGFSSSFIGQLDIALEFDDVYPYRLHFMNWGVANRKKRSNAKIILVDDEKKEVFVNKDVLAMNASIKPLFFGDIELEEEEDYEYTLESDKEKEFHLHDVKEVDFLEYIARVYMPVRPLAFKRLETLLVLADRFENEALMLEIEQFLFQQKAGTTSKKLRTLIWAGRYNMPRLFAATLTTMDKKDLKKLDPAAALTFRPDIFELLTARMIELL